MGLSRCLCSRTVRGDARFPSIVPKEWHFPFSHAAGYLRRQLLLDQNGSLGHPNPLRKGARLPIVAIDLEGGDSESVTTFPCLHPSFFFSCRAALCRHDIPMVGSRRFALVSRFDGKAERPLVAENMLKIERQAV